MTQTKLDSSQYKPAGSPAQVQFNGSGNMSASPNFTFDGTTLSVSQLSVTSIAAGFVPPVVTTAQKNAIVSPALGSIVYDSTLGFLQEWNGSAWIGVSPLYTAGTGLTLSANQFSLTTPVAISNGGTNTSSQVTNGVAYFDGTKITTSSNFTNDGTGTITVLGLNAQFMTAIQSLTIDIGGPGLVFNNPNGSVLIKSSPSEISGYTLHLPVQQGAAGTVLQNDGAGNLSFVTSPSAVPSGSNTQIQFNNSGVFGGSANLTWDGTSISLGGLASINSSNGAASFDSGGVTTNGSGRLTATGGVHATSFVSTTAAGVETSMIFDTANGFPTVDINNKVLYGGDGSTVNLDFHTVGTVKLTSAALDLNTHQIHNVVDPTSAQDAATKNYADTLYTAGTGLTLSSHQFSLTTPVAISNGGTGTTNRTLPDSTSHTSIDWDNRELLDAHTPNPVSSVDWGSRFLNDTNGNPSVRWQDRQLTSTTTNTTVDYQNCILGDTVVNNVSNSVDWAHRILYATNGSTASLNWSSGTLSLANPLPVSSGGTGTASPGLVGGSNITISGTWPNQTIAQTTAGVSGSGSTSQIPKWTSSTVLGNSGLADNGSPLGLAYTMSTGGQLAPYLTMNDLSTALFSSMQFTSHTGTFSSTNLCTFPSFSGNLVLVTGYNSSNSQCFADLLLCGCSTSSNSVTTVSSNASTLNPAGTRTYAMSGRTLTLTYSGTINVGVQVLVSQ